MNEGVIESKSYRTRTQKRVILALDNTGNTKSKILLIDDEEIGLLLISDILKSDYTVFTADNGDEAITIAENKKPDLILLDIIMPGTDGFEICRQLKKNTQTKNIPVIFLTSKSKDIDEAKGFKLGAVDYIIKPFRIGIDLQRLAVHIILAKKYNPALNTELQQMKRNKCENFFGFEKEIKELYDLTDAEASLTNGLINGYTIEEIANNTGLAYSTLRGYLRSIFLKTNTNKQHELVSSVMKTLLFWN